MKFLDLELFLKKPVCLTSVKQDASIETIHFLVLVFLETERGFRKTFKVCVRDGRNHHSFSFSLNDDVGHVCIRFVQSGSHEVPPSHVVFCVSVSYITSAALAVNVMFESPLYIVSISIFLSMGIGLLTFNFASVPTTIEIKGFQKMVMVAPHIKI